MQISIVEVGFYSIIFVNTTVKYKKIIAVELFRKVFENYINEDRKSVQTSTRTFN